MKGSFLDLKNMSERDKKLLFGDAVKGVAEWTTSKPPNLANVDKPIIQENSNELTQEPTLKRKESNEHWLQKFVIPYNNTYKSIWDIYLMFLICYSSITTAY